MLKTALFDSLPKDVGVNLEKYTVRWARFRFFVNIKFCDGHQFCSFFIIYVKVKVKVKVKDFYYNKIIIIHRMTQRLKPIWIYLSHKFLPLYTLQRPHFGDNSVSTGASTEAVQPKKLRHNRHKLHWNRSTDSSATSDGKTDTTVAVPLQWTTMMPNIEV